MTEKFDTQYELDTVKNVQFRIGLKADPSLQTVDSFAAVLLFQRSDGRRVEVAKVDDVEHEEGDIHVDRYYRDPSAEDKDFDVDIHGLWDAEEYLRENWERFAVTYLKNHGRSPHRE